jgi:hypothetical protein
MRLIINKNTKPAEQLKVRRVVLIGHSATK